VSCIRSSTRRGRLPGPGSKGDSALSWGSSASVGAKKIPRDPALGVWGSTPPAWDRRRGWAGRKRRHRGIHVTDG
jgi:hypothetical protein